MNRFCTISGNLEHRISFYHLVAFLASLPFDRFYNQLVLVSLLLHTLFHSNRRGLSRVLRWQNVILSSVIILNIVSLFYSQDKGQGWKDIQRQMAILLFPLIFSLSNFPFALYRKKLLYAFAFTCTMVIVYLYFDALRIIHYNSLHAGSLLSVFFINHNFSSPIGIHATYLSLGVALSIVFLALELLNDKRRKSRIVNGAAIVILAAGILQLASRSVLIALVVSSLFLPFFINDRKRRMQLLLASILLILVAAIGIISVDSFRKRYVMELKDDLTQAPINSELLEPRIVRWNIAWDLIENRLLTGYGSGSEKRLLKEVYFRDRLYISYLHELNTHNQYLSLWLKTGVIGLLVFLFTLLYGIKKAVRNRDSLFFFFMLLISIVAFSENLLDVNKGIFFYAFFFSFFNASSKPKEELTRLEVQNKA